MNSSCDNCIRTIIIINNNNVLNTSYNIKLCKLCHLKEYNKCYCNNMNYCINCNIKHSKHLFDIIKYNQSNYFYL